MSIYFTKTAKILIIVSLLSGCNHKNKQKLEQKEKDTHSYHLQQGLENNLKQSLEKRFAKTYKESTVKFNDGSKMDLYEPLDLSKINEISHTFFIGGNIGHIKDLNLDNEGVAIQDGKYHPTNIARIALMAINFYKITKSESAKKVFMDQVKWAEENFYQTEEYGFWYFMEPAPLYHLDAGWTSAFSQGVLLNTMLEAYKLTKERKYATIIEKALKAYMVPVEYGGFLREWDKDELWFEEYGTERPSRVLNGTIYGLEGVYNVYQDLGSQLAYKIFESGVNTIKNHLEDYNAGYSSRYSLADWKNEISQENYHEGHIIQLIWLYEVTGDEIFKKYAQIFLESDLGNFMTTSIYKIDTPKIAHVEASLCIDCEINGPKNLTDGIWAFGKFWSSHKRADLIIDFGEIKKDISAITLYHVSPESVNVNFDLFAIDNKTGKWRLIQKFDTKHIKDRVAGYNETGKYETFIEHYKIYEEINTEKLKLTFYPNKDNIIAIRELNFNYDRTQDLDHIISKVKGRISDPNFR